jgi:hypothetical protein
MPVMGEIVFVLVLNAGSSSLKFNLFDMAKETSIAEGMAERIGLADGSLTFVFESDKHKEVLPLPTHREASTRSSSGSRRWSSTTRRSTRWATGWSMGDRNMVTP